MIIHCSDCNEPILNGEKTAHGAAGTVHHHCFKRATSQGHEISLFTLMDEIDRLKRRVQDLEREVASHERSIDFRVGGS